MDWFAWLSQTDMEPSLVYEYGLLFAHNQLEEEDTAYFNHEFLQSMGIAIANHRLQILKLAKRERGRAPRIHRLVAALKKTNRRLRKFVRHWLRGDQPILYFPKVFSPVNAYRARRVSGLTKSRSLLTGREPAARSPAGLNRRCDPAEEDCHEFLANGQEIWWASMFEDLKPT